jgi:hypothetical protein
MRKPVFSVMLVLLLLAGLVVATGAAGDGPEEVEILPWLDGETYTIEPGQVGVIRYGWAACSPGLVRVFITASNFEQTLDDTLLLTPEDVDELWGAIEIYDTPPAFAEDCMGKGRPAVARWRYVLDALEPGEYKLRSRAWIDHALVDGADLEGEGKITVITPEMFYEDNVNTIIVH